MARAKRKTGETPKNSEAVIPSEDGAAAGLDKQRVSMTIWLPRKVKRQLQIYAIENDVHASDVIHDAILPIVGPVVVQMRPKRAGGGEQRPETVDGSPEEAADGQANAMLSEG